MDTRADAASFKLAPLELGLIEQDDSDDDDDGSEDVE